MMGSLGRYMVTAVDKGRSRLVIVAVNQGDGDVSYPVEHGTIQLLCAEEHGKQRMLVRKYITSRDTDYNMSSEGMHVGICFKSYDMKVPGASVVTTIISKAHQ